jgi:hypothetical protein
VVRWDFHVGQSAGVSNRVLPFAVNEYVIVENTLKARQMLECPRLTTQFTLAITDWRDQRAIVQEVSEEFTIEIAQFPISLKITSYQEHCMFLFVSNCFR